MDTEDTRIIQPARIGRRRALELLVGGGLGLGSLLLGGSADAHESVDWLRSVEELRTKVWQNPRPVILHLGNVTGLVEIQLPYGHGKSFIDVGIFGAIHDIIHRYDGRVDFFHFDYKKILSDIVHKFGILGTSEEHEAEFERLVGFSIPPLDPFVQMYARTDVVTGEQFDKNKVIDTIHENVCLPSNCYGDERARMLKEWIDTNLLPPTGDYAIRHRLNPYASAPLLPDHTYTARTKLRLQDLDQPEPDDLSKQETQPLSSQSVDEILRWTTFRNVLEMGNFEATIRDGYHLLFVYTTSGTPKTIQRSRNLAIALRAVSEKFKDKMDFLKYQDLGNERARAIFGSGYDKVPAYFIFGDGEQAYKKEGGPRNEKEIPDWVAAIERRIQKAFDDGETVFDPQRPPSPSFP